MDSPDLPSNSRFDCWRWHVLIKFWWTSQLYIGALIQMTLYCYFSWWYSNTLQDCTPLQFLETKTGAPLVVLHPPPVKKLLLSPPFLKTKTGAPFVVLAPPPPQNNNSQKNTRFLLFPFSYTSHFHLLLKHKILAKLLPRLLRGLHRFSRLALKEYFQGPLS